MAAIVQFPAIVEELIETFHKVFPDQRTRQHFAEYLTGLMVARRENAMVFYQERSYSEGGPQGSDCDFVEDSRCRLAEQSSRKQSNALGRQSCVEGVSSALDRHGVLPSGRETGIGDG